ncbi:MAG: NUDIX domain-containing protein [Dehalogenimonas sp.]
MRHRATALVFREGKVLLVKDRGVEFYSLPGGGIKHGERSIDAAARELYEETGLKAHSAGRLRECDFTGSAQHHVCLVKAHGDVKLKKRELSDYLWWDQLTYVRTAPHVRAILAKQKEHPLVPLDKPMVRAKPHYQTPKKGGGEVVITYAEVPWWQWAIVTVVVIGIAVLIVTN